MKWFCGSIAEAISFAQGRKATFVAYIEGHCEKSKRMTSVFNDREVCSSLECSRFVVVKLEAESVGYRQLVEIYKKVPIPSFFYISHTGVPLDIVDGSLFDNIEELKEAILDATIKCNQLNSNQTPPTPDIPHDKLLEERRSQIDQILENRKKNKESSSKSIPKENYASGEEKKEKVDVKQQKMSQQNAELLKLAEEREKERREEAQARQRILEQIAQDKAERAQKMKPVEIQPKTEVKTPTPNVNKLLSSQARLQFRLPTGESKSNMFQNDTKLSQIRDYIDSNFELPYRDYRLATTFPRREFTNNDNESSLEQLNLIPTAVLLILPNSTSRVSPYSRSLISLVTDLVQSFFHPIYSLTNYLRGLISGTREADQSPDTQEPSPSSNQQRQPRNYVRKVGNIHSLRDIRDANDENNTWNGNSTQQM